MGTDLIQQMNTARLLVTLHIRMLHILAVGPAKAYCGSRYWIELALAKEEHDHGYRPAVIHRRCPSCQGS